MTWEKGLEADSDFKRGQLVRSKAGHDKGSLLLVWEILDGKHVLVVDGKRRRVERPKKKRILHLQRTHRVLSREDWEQGDFHQQNARIRQALAPYQTEEESECHPKMSSR